jgi:hypothetical protein
VTAQDPRIEEILDRFDDRSDLFDSIVTIQAQRQDVKRLRALIQEDLVETKDELADLPIGVVILDAAGDVARLAQGGWIAVDLDPYPAQPDTWVALPALVLYRPAGDDS